MIQDFLKRSDPVAVLVDGDNLPRAHADAILECAALQGPVTYRRVYGNMVLRPDWDADTRFKSVHARGERGKNAADIRLVMDAMDLALSGARHSFVIAPGDSDFAPLADRLREAGHLVLGIGGERASMAFRLACTQFQQVVTLAKPVPRGLLCPLDAAILRVMRAHGDKNSIPMALLGTKLHQCEQLTAKDSGKASWTVYLKSRADCFAVEGVGNTTRARPLPILADHA